MTMPMMSVKNRDDEYQLYQTHPDVCRYIRQLEGYVHNPDESKLLSAYPERFKRAVKSSEPAPTQEGVEIKYCVYALVSDTPFYWMESPEGKTQITASEIPRGSLIHRMRRLPDQFRDLKPLHGGTKTGCTPKGVETHAGHKSVLTEAESLVHGDRNADYGHPLDDFKRTGGEAMSRYIVMHDTERGYETTIEAQLYIDTHDDAERHRIVEVHELGPIDPNVETESISRRKHELEREYTNGKAHERARIRAVLGLSI